MDFYAVLGVPINADEDMIRSAYRTLARRYHPDRGDGSSTEKFRQVAEAYETLIDPGRRSTYDLSISWARHPAVVWVEPLRAHPQPIYQESPDIFGRMERSSYGSAARASPFDELFDAWVRSIEDDFFRGAMWRW